MDQFWCRVNPSSHLCKVFGEQVLEIKRGRVCMELVESGRKCECVQSVLIHYCLLLRHEKLHYMDTSIMTHLLINSVVADQLSQVYKRKHLAMQSQFTNICETN